MQIIPTQDEIVTLLRETGALREGHFEYSNGVHTNQHVDPALAMRSYQTAKVLTVALSRKLRQHTELRALVNDASIVAATPNGMQVAYGLSYVLAPHYVYWVEKRSRNAPMAFRPFLEPERGEKIILVDDILRSGKLMAEAKTLIESYGAEVIAMAVLASLPTPKTIRFDPLPVYWVVELQPRAFSDKNSCELCREGIPVQQIGIVKTAVASSMTVKTETRTESVRAQGIGWVGS
jgi:orotate phosphoribosyltransferase